MVDSIYQQGLFSLGGQLQFRTKDGIYEAYWVDISLSTQTTPVENANDAKNALLELLSKYDFVAEARNFDGLSHLTRAELQVAMWFVWSVA